MSYSWLKLAYEIISLDIKHSTRDVIAIDWLEDSSMLLSLATSTRGATGGRGCQYIAYDEDVYLEVNHRTDYVHDKHSTFGGEDALPNRSVAVAAWLSTLHLIRDTYSQSCGVKIATPIVLQIVADGVSMRLAAALYKDVAKPSDGVWMYVVVPDGLRQNIVKLFKQTKFCFVAEDMLWRAASTDVEYASRNIAAAPRDDGVNVQAFCSPFGWRVILFSQPITDLEPDQLANAKVSVQYLDEFSRSVFR